MLDHDTDAYYKISLAFAGGLSGNLTRDRRATSTTESTR
jgi:hypothetical protein